MKGIFNYLLISSHKTSTTPNKWIGINLCPSAFFDVAHSILWDKTLLRNLNICCIVLFSQANVTLPIQFPICLMITLFHGFVVKEKMYYKRYSEKIWDIGGAKITENFFSLGIHFFTVPMSKPERIVHTNKSLHTHTVHIYHLKT